MTSEHTDDVNQDSDPTPGRPKSTGSRQQTHPDQRTQTGSAQSDKEFSDATGLSEKFKQPGSK
jgi:hypothetical protein